VSNPVISKVKILTGVSEIHSDGAQKECGIFCLPLIIPAEAEKPPDLVLILTRLIHRDSSADAPNDKKTHLER
jgi:hypothetical protein